MKKAYLLTLTTLTLLLAACGPKEEPIDPTPTNVEVSGVTLNQATLALKTGETGTLTANVQPANATNKTVTWSSSNTSVATVSNGTVTAVAEGTATITSTAGSKSATCQVTVSKNVIPVTSILLNHDSMGLDMKGTFQLNATVYPEDATEQTITWSSSDESIATVDENGLVTGVSEGKATIIAAAGGKQAKCEFEVSPVSPKAVHLEKNQITMELKDTLRLSFTYEPEYAKVESVRWSTDNIGIWVDDDGLIHANKEGTANIKVILGAFVTDICEVTVVTPDYVDKEKKALIAFYNANDGDSWSHKDNWLSDMPLELWYGISMTDDGKHVSKIMLEANNVKGCIPKEIADLTELEEISIGNKNPVPGTSAPLPEELGKLKNLKRLNLQNCSLNGTFPKSLFNLKSLEHLRIVGSEDMRPSPIPSSIGNLTNLTLLDLGHMNLTGNIPPEIGKLTGLTELKLYNNQLTGGIPASFGSLINLDKIDLSVNKLSGPIPTMVAKMDNYWKLWPRIFQDNNFTMDNLKNSKVPAPLSPKIQLLSGEELDITEFISKNQYTVLFRMYPNGNATDFLSKLAALYKTNKSKGLGILSYYDNNAYNPDNIDKMDTQFKESLSKSGATWDSFIRHMHEDYPQGAPFYAEKGLDMYPLGIQNCIVIFGPDNTVVYSSLLDQSSDHLDNAISYLQTVFKTTITHYESKSYSQDGKVTKYQTASTGKGIDIVITGDAFSDREMVSGGTFEKAAKQAVADLFSVEPYKSMKNRFNIYFVNAVSKHEEYFNGCSTTFEGVFGEGSAVGGNNKKVLEYAQKAVGSSKMDNVAVLVLMNSFRKGGTCYMTYPVDKTVYAGGSSVSWIPYKDVTVTGGVSALASTIVHELGGHGIAKLADEYAYRDQGMMSAEEVELTKYEQSNYSWYLNVDFTSDPKKVLWSQFIGDKNFSSENIGAYEGGFTFWSGIWRPTEQSVMNDSYNHSTFSAPCRSIIYTRIMKLSEGSSWKYDYNAFKTWDKAHPTKVATRSIVETNGKAPVHVPPVVVGKTWQAVIEGR